MEHFASDIEVNSLIDMEMGPDGRLYLLEYGSGLFTKNDDSALSHIEYNGGNRPPLIDNLIVDKASGKLPLTVTVEIEASDRENDAMTYVWDLGNGETQETRAPSIAYTFNDVGDYKISVEVKDDKGESAKSEKVPVVAGNSRPEVAIDLKGGDSSFFIEGVPVKYSVSVTDANGNDINESNVFVSVDYLESLDEVNKSLGHQQVSAAVMWKALTQGLDCKTCHKKAEASIGPNYRDVAKKYQKESKAMAYLEKKIVSGGGGVWGEVSMPAHLNITKDETRLITEYIMSLAESSTKLNTIPLTGVKSVALQVK